MDPEAEHFLRKLFAEDVARAEKLLGRSLPWPAAKALNQSLESLPSG